MITQNDLLKLATREERSEYLGRACFAVARDKMYPAMLDYMQERITAYPRWQTPHGSLAQYYTQARTLPAEAYQLALDSDGPGGLTDEQQALRRTALEGARLWFTQLLHLSVGLRPMVLRLEGGKDRWKL